MSERKFEIQMSNGVADAVYFPPEGVHQGPGVIHLTDIGGIRESHLQMCRQLAAKGYAVLMPNVFYRTAKPPVMDYKNKPTGDGMAKRIGELMGPLTPEAMEQDCGFYIESLASQEGAADGPMGIVGYCATGRMAMRAAAAYPEKIAAAASFHGASLCTDQPNSPHLALPRIKAELYFGHAVEDKGMPQEAIEKFDAALAAWGGRYESEVYEGAYHSWTVPDSPVYNKPQAERAFAKLTELFARTLKKRMAAN